MFGIIRNISSKNGKKLYHILGNEGLVYYYSQTLNKMQHEILMQYDRVEFHVANGNVYFVKRISAALETGEIIRKLNNYEGYVRTEKGEILKYSSSDNTEFYPLQKVKFNADRPEEHNARFGIAKNIKPVFVEHLTHEIKSEITDILRKSFTQGKKLPLKTIIDFLNLNNYSAERFGYTYELHFLEQFPLVIRLDNDAENVQIIGENDISENYKEAYRLINQMGYDDMTLLQKRVFSEPEFWNRKHILLQGTTSSGKTAIPLVKYLLDLERSQKKPKLLIAVNLRTLTVQMQNIIKDRIQNHHHLFVQISTSEYISGDNDIKNGDVDVAIVIYEKLFIFASTVKNFLSTYDHLLIDEAAIIGDRERGAKVDVILSKAVQEPNLKITLLGTPYYRWDEYSEKYNFHHIKVNCRPVPVYEYFYYPVKFKDEKKKRYLCCDSKGSSIPSGYCPTGWKNTIENICENEMDADHKTIVFTFSQSQTRELVHDIYSDIKLNKRLSSVPVDELQYFIKSFLVKYHLSYEELKGYFDTDEDYEALYRGITFHNASVPEKLRIAVENEFLGKDGLISKGIRILVSTDTLAYGINSNADTIIIANMERYAQNQYEPLSFNTYQNCIGRSGRLGYCSYGVSHVFFSEDFEKKYFNENASRFTKPLRSIRHYTRNAADENEKIFGTLGQILKDLDAKRLAFYLLSLFPIDKGITIDDLYSLTDNIPRCTDGDLINIHEAVMTSINMLKEADLIKESTESEEFDIDAITDPENSKLYITAKGIPFKGYAINYESFQYLSDLLDDFINDKKFYPIDYFVNLASVPEVYNLWKNFILLTYEKGEERKANQIKNNPDFNENEKTDTEKQIYATYSLIEKMLPKFMEKQWISSSLYERIINFASKGKEWKRLNDNKYKELIEIRAAVILGMWISGYNVQMLREIQQSEETIIDDIRRKLGEKSSYYTDICHAIAQSRNYGVELLHSISLLSISLFYGIRYDWLCLDNPQLSAELANNYHIASMCAARLELVQNEDKQDKLYALKKEFEVLEPSVRKILENRGVI